MGRSSASYAGSTRSILIPPSSRSLAAVIHDPELFTVGPDEVVITFRTDDDREIETRVGARATVTVGPYHAARVMGLEPSTTYRIALDGAEASAVLPDTVTTLAAPPGRLLTTIATVNDVHFGEVECGKLGTSEEVGPVFTAGPGEEPYPETMNRGAIAAIEQLDPDAVIVKGDLTNLGTEDEYDAFLRAYSQLGPRMHHIRGNPGAMVTDTIAATGPFAVELDGVTLAVVDTTIPGTDRGRLPAAQLSWLDDLAASSAVPVLLFGHHHPWDPNASQRSQNYFGINPDDSVALCGLIER